MRASNFLVILLLLIAIGVAGFFAGQYFTNTQQQSDAVVRFATVEVIITATRDPNATPLVRIITATPRENEIAALPTGVLDATASLDIAAAGTPDPNSTPDPRRASGTGETAEGDALPEGCIAHTLEAGQSPGLLAEIYEVSLERILEVNGLDDESSQFLQIGQTLIVPLVGCPLEGSAVTPEGEDVDATTEGGATVLEGTTTPTPEATPTPSLTPTITLAPTATDAQVVIDQVVGAGDVTSEAVIIRNTGRTVDITGWTLRDLDGNVYTFAEQRLFDQGTIEVFSRVGQNTAPRKFWGRTEAVWGEPGDVAILSNAAGQVQAVLRLSELNLP